MSSTESAPRWRRLEPDQRRAQILACARRLFGERHYEAVSTTELARESGVARGLINHYFGTKRELYLEVVRDLMFIPEYAVEKLAHGSIEQRASASIERFLAVIERNRSMWLSTVGTGGYGRDPDVKLIFEEAQEITADRMIQKGGLEHITEGRKEKNAMNPSFTRLGQKAARERRIRKKM